MRLILIALLALLLASPVAAQADALSLVVVVDANGPALDLTIRGAPGQAVDVSITAEAPLRITALVTNGSPAVTCTGETQAFTCTTTIPASGAAQLRLLLAPIPPLTEARAIAVTGLGETEQVSFSGPAPASTNIVYFPQVSR
jgi:hypothetical protein